MDVKCDEEFKSELRIEIKCKEIAHTKFPADLYTIPRKKYNKSKISLCKNQKNGGRLSPF